MLQFPHVPKGTCYSLALHNCYRENYLNDSEILYKYKVLENVN